MELEPVAVRVLPREEAPLPALRGEARNVAIAAAARRARSPRRFGRRQRPAKVVASRSFLVDVHLLGNR